LGRPRS